MEPEIAPLRNAQAATLDELRHNLKEVLELCFEEENVDVPQFVGIQQIEIEA
jgi:predicted RNase H-like HicB family nuclease